MSIIRVLVEIELDIMGVKSERAIQAIHNGPVNPEVRIGSGGPSGIAFLSDIREWKVKQLEVLEEEPGGKY